MKSISFPVRTRKRSREIIVDYSDMFDVLRNVKHWSNAQIAYLAGILALRLRQRKARADLADLAANVAGELQSTFRPAP